MSDVKSNNDNKSGNKGAGPTRSFDSSIEGPGTQIGQFRIERELGRRAIVTHWANGPLKIF